MHIGDIALKTSRLNTPPPRYLDRVIMKGQHVLRYSNKLFLGNVIWYCYPSKEKKTLGKCIHFPHVSFFNPFSHWSHWSNYNYIVEILIDANCKLNWNGKEWKSFDTNLITLSKSIQESKTNFQLFDEYKIKPIDLIRRERTQGGKRVKRNKTLKSYFKYLGN
jgi:hypothetical protein